MNKSIGKKVWAIGDGYIPKWSHGPEPEMQSHGSLGILNVNSEEANIEVTLYYSDQEPVGPYRVSVPARRTRHVRLNELDDPQKIPVGEDFAVVMVSDLPIVVQHTRLDSRQAENGLFSTMAYASD